MPAKKHQITDAQRAKRIRDAAKEHETSNDPKDFERAFSRVVKDRELPVQGPKRLDRQR